MITWHAAYPNCDILNGDINGDGTVGFGDINPFTILLSGAGSGAGGLRAEYTWDAENCLIGVTPLAPTADSKKVEFQHDYQGRRIEKLVYDWNVDDPNNPYWETTPAVVRRFVWSGWLLLMELNGLNDNAPVRKYTWGLDLAGQMGWAGSLPAGLAGAGGVGGLLAMQDVQDPNDPNDDLSYVYFYDANGNVGQVVDLSHDPNDPAGAIVAKYEYDPYGNRTNDDPNAPEVDQPFRFSTKYFDTETGLSYFGGRYYNASLGRWINRDPIGELGGRNLYEYAANDPLDRMDPLGMMTLPGCGITHACPQCPKKGNGGSPLAYGGFGGLPQQPVAPPAPPRSRYTKPYGACPPGQTRPDLGNGYRGTCRTPNNQGATTNGCSFVQDAPGGFDFKPGCDEHDRCYSTLGKTKQECDNEFLRDLLRICISYPRSDQRDGCFAWAKRYYDGVRKWGGGAYFDAQREAINQEGHDAAKRQGRHRDSHLL